MAISIWTGGAVTRAQIDDVTPATVDIGNDFTITLTDDDARAASIVFRATAATAANVCTGLAAAWAASSDPLFRGVTIADGTTKVTVTSNAAGVPFVCTATAAVGAGGGAPTNTRATSVASSGPNDWKVAANWHNQAVPSAGTEDVIIASSAPSILYGLNTGLTITSLTVEPGYAGNIGRWGPAGGTYGVGGLHYLQFADIITSCKVEGSGSLAALHIAASNIPVTINQTGTPTTGRHVVYLHGTEITTLYHDAGNTVCGAYGLATAIDAAILLNGGTLYLTPTVVTATPLAVIANGALYDETAIAVVKVVDGGSYYPGSGITCANVSVYEGGTLYPNNNVITALYTYAGSTVAKTDSLVQSTFTNWTLYGATTLENSAGRITFTNAPVYAYVPVP